MRDSSGWRGALAREMRHQSFPEDVMPCEEFLQVELGLYFMTRHLAGEPVGALQALLSGYVRPSEDLSAVTRRVRHRMGDVARRGYWRRLLNQYMRIPDAWRAFDRTDDPTRRVNDHTVFAPRPSSFCLGREQAYPAALADPLIYTPTPTYPAAQPGERYTFQASGKTHHVQFPSVLPLVVPIEPIRPQTARVRQPWTISFDKDLATTAAWVDEQLATRPDITNRNFTKRLTADMRFNTVDPASVELIDRPADFTLDGVEHFVGLMNSGKTTLADLITINRVRDHDDRVGLVVSSVGDVFAKVSFLRALGINAVPLIGRSSRGEHAARYWRTMVEEAENLIPDEFAPADAAAVYANTSCLLEPFRQHHQPDWAPLDPDETPCRGRLREADTERSSAYDCPLLSVCPAQKAHREIAAAQVWVTTPQCLITSKAEPATVSMRWFEAAQHHLDLLVIDEADAVQQVLDSKFVQTEQLVAADKGWTHRMIAHTNSGLDQQSMAPVVDADVTRWQEGLQIHEQAVFALNRLALTPSGQPLKDLLGDATFTAHSLLRQVARTLFGLPKRVDGDKVIEDLADDFYREHLQDFAERPENADGHGLTAVAEQLTRQRRDDDAVAAAIDEWIDAHVSTQHVTPAQLEHDRNLLRLVIEAATWAARITTTFFEMATIYPSVRARLRLPDEETFWLDQPPRDYRPLVPEAPMGNILALRWAANRNGGASLQLLWVHGVGRWLLHHAHDLLSDEGVDGPHVILTSATSWAPGSSFYHIPITPTAVLRQPDADQAALMTSTMTVKAARTGTDDAIFVSGQFGQRRADALRQMVTALCEPVDGRHRSIVDELRAGLPADRQQLLFVVLSGREASQVSDHVNNRTPLRARNVVPDAADPGKDGILRRLVGGFGKSPSDILVAAEMSIQRGYNILNSNDTAALGAVIYLTRSHPPPFDLAFPLSMVSQLALGYLQDPPVALPGDIADTARQMRNAARGMWFDVIGRPIQFRNLDPRYRSAFVANNLVPMSQTIGRSIRGNQPTKVLLCDAAFAERLATKDSAPDTQRTSLVVATDLLLSQLLTDPGPDACDEDRRLYAINTAVWGLMGHLVRTNHPLGSRRKTSHG
ncbi:hypothetical protein AB0M43_35315 [Longispora sp. NPDC051575]|uniref:pPIWI_RE_Z domain-containing protein n=1 Tax=Longispora sp. NPDC051575 TaxID=3154943 RepID=UPI00343214B5